MSRIRVIDRLSDEIVVYESDQYVCLMKLFPMCRHEGDISEEDYRRFHLRFYLPREYFTDAHKRIDEILVMTNGLDEFSHYTLYDELGSRFASNGLACVLMPLPDHLHRHTRFRINHPSAKQIIEKPSETMMRNPIRLYELFLQFKQELAQLRDHLMGTACGDPEGACRFYKHLFAPQVRVSYMGYSLGAAATLCDFLESEASLNACFLLNGAIQFRHITSEKMFPQKQWKAFTRRLEEEYRKRPDQNRLFEEVFLGQFVSRSQELLREHGRRVLFIFGGRDSLTSYKNMESIAPEEWGSGMLVLPGINHFLGIDEEWKKWIALVVKLILEFKENAVRRTITKEELERHYRLLGEKEFNTSEAALQGMQRQQYRAKLIGMDSPRIADAENEKRAIKELVKSKKFEELKLGLMLYQGRMITVEELLQALEIQRASFPRRRIGDILVDELKVVHRNHVEALASIQYRPSDKLARRPRTEEAANEQQVIQKKFDDNEEDNNKFGSLPTPYANQAIEVKATYVAGGKVVQLPLDDALVYFDG